jgi:prevent-host-death family protein
MHARKVVNVHEAKTHLSKLLEDVAAGEEIVIAKAGKPVAKLVAIEKRPRIKLGIAEGEFTVPDDFDAPLPDEILALFYGREDDDLS